MLVELGLVEQRYQAVLEVLNDGASVTDVARRYGVARQTVHEWLRAYAAEGLGGLADRSSRPLSCPHQMAAGGRGADRGDAPGASGVGAADDPVSGSSGGGGAVAGAHVGRAVPGPSRAGRPRRPGSGSGRTTSGGSESGRWSCGRWTSSAGCGSSTGREAKIVSGIDDHSRFVVSARVVARATARPVCDALALAMRTPWGARADPDRQRQGVHRPVRAGPGPVLFDRICVENGIKHLLTAPRSPTTTGQGRAVAQDAARASSSTGKVFASIDDAQAQLDEWVRALQPRAAAPVDRAGAADRAVPARRARRRRRSEPSSRPEPPAPIEPVTTRRVSAQGHDLLRHRQLQGRACGWPARPSRWSATAGWCSCRHRGVLIATHARRHPVDKQTAGLRARPRAATVTPRRPPRRR